MTLRIRNEPAPFRHTFERRVRGLLVLAVCVFVVAAAYWWGRG